MELSSHPSPEKPANLMPKALSKNHPMKRILPILAGAMVAIALMVSFGIDLTNTAQGGAVDLRNRITGMRLLEHGIDPYHYKWTEGQPAEYIDLRNNPHQPVSKTTVTPALLLLHGPVANVPYRVTQYLCLIAQWLLLIGTGWIWWRARPTPLMAWLVAPLITAFSYTQAWRWQAERGQAYVLLTFVFAWWLTTTRRAERGSSFAGGLIAGFLIALRPPLILLVPFLCLHRRGQLIGTAAGALLGLGLPMLWRPSVWTDYFSAMQTYSDLYRNGVRPGPNDLKYPATVEGIPTATLGHLMPFHAGDFSIHGLLRWFVAEPFPTLPLLFAVAAAFAGWLWWTRGETVERLLPGLAGWFFLSDLFLPALRFSYHDVFILNVVMAEIVIANQFPRAAWPCVVALPLGWAVYAFWPTAPWVINLPAFFFMLGAIGSLFSFSKPAANEREEAA